MKLTVTSILLALLSNTKSAGQTDSFPIQADHYTTNTFDVAIFPSNYPDILKFKRFTPTRAQIDTAEVLLHGKLSEENAPDINRSHFSIIKKRLEKYKRQYFGYIDENGDFILLINSFPADDKYDCKQWLTDRILVFDGGPSYWRVKFNLTRKIFFDFNTNGFA